MPEKPVMHGRDHRPGGIDPIPGITPGVPVGMVRRTGTQTISASTATAITWDQSAISDSSFYSWSSGSNLHLAQSGTYMTWFAITADTDWPASASGYITWQTSVSGAGNVSTTILSPFGAHTNIDVFSPSGVTSGGVSTVTLIRAFDACNLTGVVDNQTSSSFVVGVLATLIVYRLCDGIDFA